MGDATTSLAIISFSELVRDPRVLRQIKLFAPRYRIITIGFGPPPAGAAHHIEVPAEYRDFRPGFRHRSAMVMLRQFSRLYFKARRTTFILEQLPPGQVDIALANDAEAAPLATALKPRLGVHADMHEYATRQGENMTWWRYAVAPFRRWMVAKYVTQSDSVTTVSPGLANEYHREFGIRCAIVPNASAYRSDLSPRPLPADGPLRIVHAGAAGRARHLEYMVEAVAETNRQRPGSFTFDLYLQPGDLTYIQELRSLTSTVGQGSIRIHDPVPFEQLVETMAQYDVGFFSTPPASFNLKHTLPNKLFEFVQARLAVVIGPTADMKDYVDRYGIGQVAQGFTAPDLTQALLDMSRADVQRAQQAADHYAYELSAESLSSPWTDAIDDLARKQHVTSGGDHA